MGSSESLAEQPPLSPAQQAGPPRDAQAPAQMRWWGWGDAKHEPSLGAGALQKVAEAVGLGERPQPPVALEHVRVLPSALSDAAAEELRGLLGEDRVRTDHVERVLHAAGKGHLDLVRLRAGEPHATPDAVLHPGDEQQLRAILDLCARRSIAVVPFGGGTSVVGGLAPLRGANEAVVSLDLAALCRISLDRESRIVTAGAGLRVAELERRLRSEGLTLGHFPQSYEYVSLGGCAATRSAGQASSGYGRFEEMVMGLKLIAPEGELDAITVPASAAGPDLRQLIVGSEGALGVISSLSLRLHRTPPARSYEGFMFEGFAAGVKALRTLAQDGPKPTVARLSEQRETELSLALSQSSGLVQRLGRRYVTMRSHGEGCLAILGFEGEEQEVALARRRATQLAKDCGAQRLGRRVGEAWLAQRFAAPYLRDELLTHGVMVETLETATTWAKLEHLRAGVTTAIERALAACGTPGLVGCHISHIYEGGASLYFTFLAKRQLGSEERQWHAVKQAACEAIVGRGGTLSHHHGVGIDHAPWIERELGVSGVAALRALKAELDPAGVMNPGKLLPEEQPSSPIRAA
ncbi:MAG TPA: FAD-binding oxidoreductase [Solirubrobacteraceae bacterium]|jgi:alkyldihydroxyacetonephosphate synthase